MKFSVIVPVFNVQEYILECCDSVLHQLYQNYELILVDDGSTDNSGAVCDQIFARFPERCVVIHTANQGPLLARQIGLRAASGDYIVFLDADDCIREDLLETLAACFQKTGCDIVFYNASNKNDYSNKFCSFPLQHNRVLACDDKSVIYSLIVHSKIPNAMCLKAAKRRCFDHFPDFTDFSYVRNGEDLLMSLYMVTEARKIVYLDEILYFYRQREGSTVHSYSPNRALSIKTVHRELERFIDLWGMPELHPALCAREVRSWIETVLILFDNKNHMEPAVFRDILQNMSADDYFRRAYAKMDPEALSGKYRLLAKWLYHRRFWCLQIADLFRTVKMTKSK